MTACSNPYCRAGVCRGPRSPHPHRCRACLARWEAEAARLVDDAEARVLLENGSRGARSFLEISRTIYEGVRA